MATATKTKTKKTPRSRSSSAPEPKPKTARERYSSWPKKGGFDGPQPWQLRELGVNPADLEQGAPDTLSPVDTDHGRPILVSGSAGPEVLDLSQRLAALGYDSSTTRGENPFLHVDQSVLAAVEQFRRDYDVQEDPEAFGGDNPEGRRLAQAHIGPLTWAALIRASDKAS